MRQWFSQKKDKDPLIGAYRQYRNLGKQSATEIIECFIDEKSLRTVGKLLGIAQGREFVIEDESEVDALMDFQLYEYKVDDKNFVQRYLEAEASKVKDIYIDAELRSLLEAQLKAFTSLFRIDKTDPSRSRISLVDLLNPHTSELETPGFETPELEIPELEIIDINLSQSAKPGMLLFTRIVPLPEFNMTSGLYFVFVDYEEKDILKRYKVLEKKVKSDVDSIRRFVAFFKLNRTHGLQVKTRSI